MTASELINMNARLNNALQRNGIKRRVGALSFPNITEGLMRRHASTRNWYVELLKQLDVNQAAVQSVARQKSLVQ